MTPIKTNRLETLRSRISKLEKMECEFCELGKFLPKYWRIEGLLMKCYNEYWRNCFDDVIYKHHHLTSEAF